MIKLEQIRLLEQKVRNAVSKIAALKAENEELRSKQDEYQARISELESLLEQYKSEQGEIKQGILAALNRLDELEDVVVEAGAPRPPQDTFVVEEETASETGVAAEAPAESVPTTEPAAKKLKTDSPEQKQVSSARDERADKPATGPAREAPSTQELGEAAVEPSDNEEPEDENEQELDIF